MKNMMQWMTTYKRYDVNCMHVDIIYTNVFTELCSINETSAFRIMWIISANFEYDVAWAALPRVSAIVEMCRLTTQLLSSYLSSWNYTYYLYLKLHVIGINN